MGKGDEGKTKTKKYKRTQKLKQNGLHNPFSKIVATINIRRTHKRLTSNVFFLFLLKYFSC